MQLLTPVAYFKKIILLNSHISALISSHLWTAPVTILICQNKSITSTAFHWIYSLYLTGWQSWRPRFPWAWGKSGTAWHGRATRLAWTTRLAGWAGCPRPAWQWGSSCKYCFHVIGIFWTFISHTTPGFACALAKLKWHSSLKHRVSLIRHGVHQSNLGLYTAASLGPSFQFSSVFLCPAHPCSVHEAKPCLIQGSIT